MSENVLNASDDLVFTASRIWAWWLIHAHGYQVVSRRMVPRLVLFGEIQMIPHWILSAPAVLQNRS